jgi:hypothetical protein
LGFSQENNGFGNIDLVYAFAELIHLAKMRPAGCRYIFIIFIEGAGK